MSYLRLSVFAAALVMLGGRVGADAPVPTTAYSFSGLDGAGANTDGALPLGGLTDGGDGYFYGVASAGGSLGGGAIYRLRADGTQFAVLHSLDPNTEGSGSMGALTLGGDGWLYGTTSADGPDEAGAVFRLHPDGSGFAVLHTFDGGVDGGFCPAGVIPGGDGYLYGVAGGGDSVGDGTLFRMHPDGSGFMTLYTFTGDEDGGEPLSALTVSGGVLYGTTFLGGASSSGTVFRMAPDGSGFTTLYDFAGVEDGASPAAGLTVGRDGLLYGATVSGGDLGDGTLFRLATDGSGFATLYSFDADTDGSEPFAAPRFGVDGRLYGTAFSKGPSGSGTAYSVAGDGTSFTVLGAFSGDVAGSLPGGVLLVGSAGRLYGTAYNGGSAGAGTVFSLDAPPVTVTPTPDPTPITVIVAPVVTPPVIVPPVVTPPVIVPPVVTPPVTVTEPPVVTPPVVTTVLSGTIVTTPPVTMTQTHILWKHQDGQISLWTVQIDGSFRYFTYGPYAGWTAIGVATGADGMTHILWRHVDGTASVWNLNAQGQFTFRNYGPYAGWAPSLISAASDGGVWIVWKNTSGEVALWRVGSDGELQKFSQYGPYAGWSPVGLASSPQGKVRITWNHTPDGKVALWDFDPDTFLFSDVEYGGYSGWTPGTLGIDARGHSRILWTHANGRMALWDLLGGTLVNMEYGPYDGWKAQADAVGGDGLGCVLWTHTTGQAALWSINAQGNFIHHEYGPYAGWSAVAVSAGP